MSLRITLLPCLAAAFILGVCENACESDKGAGPSAPSSDKTSLLTSAQWKQNAHSVTPAVDWRMDGIDATRHAVSSYDLTPILRPLPVR